MVRKPRSAPATGDRKEASPTSPADREGYEPPRLFRVGTVFELTRGSSSSGTSDANSQYYW